MKYLPLIIMVKTIFVLMVFSCALCFFQESVTKTAEILTNISPYRIHWEDFNVIFS